MKPFFRSIPLSHYFEQAYLDLEFKRLFAGRPEYLGCDHMLPNDGDYKAIQSSENAKVLIRESGKIRLFDNVCSHRQALLLQKSGNTKRVVCPVHHWSYDTKGRCLNTPLIECDKQRMNLKEYPIHQWKQLIFSGQSMFANSMKQFEPISNLDLTNYTYSDRVTETLDLNWKHLIDIFTEDYHVPFAHPGFSSTIETESLVRTNFKEFTAQTFLMRDRKFLETCRSTPSYRAWIDIVLKAYPQQLPTYGGILILFYPNIMIEWYPFSMIVSTVQPVSIDQTVCHYDFYHDAEAMARFPELKQVAEQSFLETSAEDSIICERIVGGRKALYHQGRDPVGPLQPSLEEGIQIFHSYYLNRMLDEPSDIAI